MSFQPPYPSESSGNGFYNPQQSPFPALPSYQAYVNSNEGKIDINTLDAINNLIKQLPSLRQEALELAGEYVVWIRRKTEGVPCPNADVNGQCRQSKCSLCFGTGFTSGYDAPIIFKASFMPGKSDILIEEAGLHVTQRPTAWTIITYPLIAERDILVTYSNERYEVHSSDAIEHKGYRHYQELTLSRIDKNDSKYYIDVPGINGQVIKDFPAFLTINPAIGQVGAPGVNYVAPGQGNGTSGINIPVSASYATMPGANFPAMIQIRNYYFNPHDGLTE